MIEKYDKGKLYILLSVFQGSCINIYSHWELSHLRVLLEEESVKEVHGPEK